MRQVTESQLVNGYEIREVAINLRGGKTRIVYDVCRPNRMAVARNFKNMNEAVAAAKELDTMFSFYLPSGAEYLLTEKEAETHEHAGKFC